MGAKDGVALVVSALETHVSNDMVWYWGCGVLNNLALERSLVDLMLGKHLRELCTSQAAALQPGSQAHSACTELLGKLPR